MRKERGEVFPIVALALLVIIGLVVPSVALGAGDDCPPPSEGDNNEVYTPPPDDEEEEQPAAPQKEETTEDSDGALTSLGDMSGHELIMAAVVVVGVIVGVVYLVMVGRMNEDEIEYEE